MSLIDEALKRAREQAERQQGAQRSAASRWVPSYPLAQRRSRALVWTGLAAGCLLLGVGAGLVASRFTGEKELGTTGATLAEPEAAAPGGDGSSAAAGAVLFEETTDLTTDPSGVPFPLPTTGLPPDVPLEPVPLPVPEPPAAEVDEVPIRPPTNVQPSPPGDPPPPPAAEPAPPAATHTRRAPVPGGGAIELGGIAFSANQPVALLNGRVVGVGEVVEGFTVISIEPRRVELRGHGTTVFLSLD